MNAEEFAEIIKETKGVVLSAAEKNLAPAYADSLDDVVQETYIRAYKSLLKNQFRGESALSTWLYAIARNESLRMNRKRMREEDKVRREQTRIQESRSEFSSGYPGDEIRTETLFLNGLLEKLPEKYSAVLTLYGGGYSEKEIAVKLNISRGTVKSRAARGRELLLKLRNQER